MIRLIKVSKRYPTRPRPVLHKVDLHLPAGQFAFLTGPSGAGKTTLLRMLFGAEHPNSGQIRVGGADLARIKPRQLPLLRRKVGVIYQDFKLLKGESVFENVALALRVCGQGGPRLAEQVLAILKRVGLEHAQWALVETLSGGEQQRVAIARALVSGPPLILADEPTGNLDPLTALEVMRLLATAHAQGATVLVATHDPKLLGLVRGARVITLAEGRLREEG